MSVEFERRGAVGILTLARPDKLNAMTHEMGDRLQDVLAGPAAASDLRCLVLRAAGRAFSAGGDLAFLQDNLQRLPADNEADMRGFYGKFLALREVAVPTVALVQGRATGAGLCLALACDVRILAADALLSFNFVRLGLTPGMGGTWFLPRLVGPSRAADLAFTGRTLSAAEALAWGLAEYVVPDETLLAEGLRWAEQVAGAAPEAIKATKRLLRANASLDLSEALDAEARAQAEAFAGAELPQGLSALLERRTPQFS